MRETKIEFFSPSEKMPDETKTGVNGTVLVIAGLGGTIAEVFITEGHFNVSKRLDGTMDLENEWDDVLVWAYVPEVMRKMKDECYEAYKENYFGKN